MPIPRPILVLFVALCLLTALPAHSQVLYGSLVGVVEDPSGSVIPNVAVTATNSSTGQTYEAKTDEGGRFSLTNVLPGDYEVKVAASGFRTQARSNVRVTSNTVTRADMRLEVGQLAEQITVEAGVSVLQTDKSDTHTELNSKQIANLPLPGFRNYQSLINLVPGATPAGFQNSITDTPGRSLTTNINGTNRNNNTTRIDGAASVNLWLPHHAGYVMPAEMVDTVNITTSASDAEQGLAGGAAITVITKSGTNELHGSLFEYHDNQRLYARNFFLPSNQNKPVSNYNNFGGTIGGPIKKNKLFFFYSYDNTKQRSGAFGRYSVPEADFRAGNFSRNVATTIYDPATGAADGSGRTPFAGNIIPGSRISPIAQRVQAFYPLPNIAGAVDANNFSASATPAFNRQYNDVKINYNRNSNHSIWGRYSRMDALVVGFPIFGEGVGPAPGSDPGTGDTLVQNASLGHTLTLSPTLLLDGVIGYQRQDQVVQSTDFGKDFSQSLGIPGIGGADPREKGFPNINITGFNGFGAPGWMPLERIEENYTMSHNLTWIKGAHTFRFGFDGTNYRMTHWQPELGAGPRGAINFSGGPTALGPTGVINFNHAYASFLLGESTQMQKSIQYIIMTPREFQFGWYGQDRWQVSRKLTLTLGLRYEYYPLMTRAAGKGIERLDPETNQVFLGGRGNVPRNVGVTVSKTLFAPSIGFAYRATDKTVVRGGYGLHYDPLPFSRPLRGFYPLTVNFAFNQPGNAFTTARKLADGIPPVTGPDLSSGVVNLPAVADMRSPYAGEINRGYIQSWNFTLERRLPMDLITSVAYVGTQSVHLLADRDINSGFPGSGSAGRPYAARFNRLTSTLMWDGYLSANYHSLQTSVRKQFSKGVMLQGSYTWSKAINLTDDDGWAGVNWNWGPVFNRNRAAAGYDRTHMFNLGWVYELPFGKGKQFANAGGALNHIVGGWSVNGVIQAYTGTPFTVTAPGGSVNAPSNLQTADQVGPVDLLRQVGPGTNWFSPGSFRAVTEQRFGTTGRNILRNPSVWNTDVMLNKNIAVTEKVTLDFRSEFYNLPNTSHFGGVASSDVTNPNFMRILSAFGERRIRFGLRLGF
ncbi:MAG: carboxypeptidase regulatory-like domain-containing protein [Bryobacteraceae bacterium]|nr:carboxypeptidase regulatory-like domain-containing protein [Bryobacteraceae bacterium]